MAPAGTIPCIAAASMIMRAPVLFAAPHRVMFLAGTIQALLVMGFWSLDLGGRHAGLWPTPPWPLLESFPAFLLHAVLLSLGVFPLFIFGFILTAGPRWQGAEDSTRRDFIPAFLLLACGWLLVWVALVLPQLLVAGLALALGGWIAVALTLTRLARRRAYRTRTYRLCLYCRLARGGWACHRFEYLPPVAPCHGRGSAFHLLFGASCCRSF
ncbi:MAG: NnrS family protein [Saprospiraceae bacterium]